MAIWSAVTCYEEYDDTDESHGLETSGGSVLLRCAWADRYLLIADVLGRQHAHVAGLRAARATLRHDGAAAATDGSGQILTTEDALVAVEYDSRVTEDLITEELVPTVEFITLDWRKFRWGAANGKRLHEDEAPGRQFRTLRLARSEGLVSSIHADEVNLVGSVNDTAYVSSILGQTFAIGTLLFEGSRIVRTTDTTGATRYSLDKSFIYNKETWNKWWRAETQAYEEIFIAGGAAYKNFPEEDLSNVLY